MAERKQKEIETQAAEHDRRISEIRQMKTDIDSLNSQVERLMQESLGLGKDLHQKQCVIDEKDEEIYALLSRIETLVHVTF